jgi:TfoX/Sxy family transcriptional regulator of competence genes
MGCNPELVERVARGLAKRGGVTERRMFGGICFLLNGNMVCGAVGDDLVVRVAATDYDAALAMPHARPMDFTGRPLKGFVYVAAAGWQSDAELATWLGRAIAHAASLPRKTKASIARKPRVAEAGVNRTAVKKTPVKKAAVTKAPGSAPRSRK